MFQAGRPISPFFTGNRSKSYKVELINPKGKPW